MSQKVEGVVPPVVFGIRTVVWKNKLNEKDLFVKLLSPSILESCTLQMRFDGGSGFQMAPSVKMSHDKWEHVICLTYV